MTLSPFLATHDSETVRLRAGVFVAEMAYEFRTSQTAIIAALLPIITPSQPLQSSSHAPAADTSTMPPVDEATDGAATASLPSEPSVSPIWVRHWDVAASDLDPSRVHLANCIMNCGTRIYEGDDYRLAPNDEFYCAACWATVGIAAAPPPSPLPGDPAGEAGSPPNPAPTSSAAFSPAPNPSLNDRVLETYAEHPDWSNDRIASHVGCSRSTVSSWLSPLRRAAKASTTEALKAELEPQARPAPEAPPAATPEPATDVVEPPPAKPLSLGKRIAAFVADHPDATLKDVTDAMPGERMQSIGWAAQKAGIVLRKYTPEERSEVAIKAIAARDAKAVVTVANEPRRVLPTHAPRGAGLSTRFYVRDGNRYLHQSLEPSPTDDGPLMTVNRAYAWFDNAQRFEGARKLWPEIATMRKDAP